MPIFMDRHEVPGLTAQDVAEAHSRDLAIQHRYECRALTYWYDDTRETAFCLIEAPRKQAVEQLHEASHGFIPNKIIEVEREVVESFLGRIAEPGTREDTGFHELIGPAFRTVMVTALDDSSMVQFLLEAEKGWQRLREFHTIVRETVSEFKGNPIRETGVTHIASFTSVSGSIECALDLHQRIREFKMPGSETTIQITAGLNAGEPVGEDDGFFGNVTQMATRLCYIADAGEILLSSTVRDQYPGEDFERLSVENMVCSFNPEEEDFLNRVMEVLESRWDEGEFNVEELGRLTGISRSQLYRKLTAVIGKSPHEFIQEYRLVMAQNKIRKQQDNISQIAFACGFNSPSYFSKCFRERFGILPSTYAGAFE